MGIATGGGAVDQSLAAYEQYCTKLVSTNKSLMANLDFFGTPKMTVTKFQNRLRSFGAETRAEVSARRNSSKYVTRLKAILTSYKICAAKHFTVSAWK